MGIIARQSFKASFVNFLGAVIGFFSLLFINPLNIANTGFVNSIIYIATSMAPFISWGLSAVGVKYYFLLKNDKNIGTKGFIGFLLFSLFLNFSIYILLSVIFNSYLLNILKIANFKIEIFTDYYFYLVGLSLLISITTILNSYSSIQGRVVVPSIVINFGLKIFLPLILLLTYFNAISPTWIPLLLLIYYCLATIIMCLYLKSLNSLDLDFKFADLKNYPFKDMTLYSLVNGLAGFAVILTTRIDVIAISGFLGYEAVGKYTLPLFMVAVIDIPNISMNGITGPIISKAIAAKEVNEINKIYQTSALNLFIIGALIFMGIYLCYDDVSAISAKADVFEGTKIIFFMIGIAKLFDMMTGVNNQIIVYSNHYYYLISVIISGVFNLCLSFFLIPKYGLWGAGFSLLITTILFNLLKMAFIFQLFRIQPISAQLIKAIAISGISFFCVWLIPIDYNPYFNIILKAVVTTSLFIGLLYFMSISTELNRFMLLIKSTILTWKNRLN